MKIDVRCESCGWKHGTDEDAMCSLRISEQHPRWCECLDCRFSRWFVAGEKFDA